MMFKREDNPFGIVPVCEGDCLASLCRAAGVTELSVVRLNRLSRPPEEGEMLLFPTGALCVRTAAAGDSPASLCAKTGTEPDEFALWNGEEIFPGQEVLVRAVR